MADGLEDIKNHIGKIGAIVAAIVGINTGITSCTNASIERVSGFRAAVAQEEALMKGFFDQYVALAGEENPELRERRAFALAQQLKRPVPDFAEFRSSLGVDHLAIADARNRLRDMKLVLEQAMQQSEVVGEAVAETVQQRSVSQSSDAVPTADGRTALPNSVRVATAPVQPDLRTLQIAMRSRSGWDLDIFWCVVGDDEATNASNFETARGVATALASPSFTDVEVGRVRLRPLPELRQGVGLPARGSGLSIRSDANAAEREAAEKIRSWLAGGRPSYQFASNRSAQNTNYYISLFVCAAPPIS